MQLVLLVLQLLRHPIRRLTAVVVLLLLVRALLQELLVLCVVDILAAEPGDIWLGRHLLGILLHGLPVLIVGLKVTDIVLHFVVREHFLAGRDQMHWDVHIGFILLFEGVAAWAAHWSLFLTAELLLLLLLLISYLLIDLLLELALALDEVTGTREILLSKHQVRLP